MGWSVRALFLPLSQTVLKAAGLQWTLVELLRAIARSLKRSPIEARWEPGHVPAVLGDSVVNS